MSQKQIKFKIIFSNDKVITLSVNDLELIILPFKMSYIWLRNLTKDLNQYSNASASIQYNGKGKEIECRLKLHQM